MSTRAPQGQPTISYGYDPAGRVTSVSDVAGAFTYGYDTAARNTSVTRPDAQVVSYQYDANGNRTRVTWPSWALISGSSLAAGTGSNNWNRQWNDFFNKNPGATREDIFRQLDKMQQQFYGPGIISP